MMNRDDVVVLPMTEEHWPQVERIYAEGIATGNATFETGTPTWESFDASRLDEHRLIATTSDLAVLGWVACTRTSARDVYAGVVEHSVYVSRTAQGSGIGSRLLEAFIRSTEQGGIWTIQSSIFAENVASLRLHERHGFRKVGTRERVARATAGPYAGEWRDTVLIERRSEVTGIE